MHKQLSSLNHRLLETIKKELGPEYVRLFAPHFISHGIPAGITGMMLSGSFAIYVVLLIANLDDFATHFFYLFIPIVVFVLFTYTFPFQNMVVGKSYHLLYFRRYGLVCTLAVLIGAFIAEPIENPANLLEAYFQFLPALVGIVFCLILHSKKFAVMLAYQQKLWAIKTRLIAEDKALVAELGQRTKKRAKK